MTYQTGFTCEDLWAAIKKSQGFKVHKAAPVTGYEWQGSERVQKTSVDFFGVFDQVCIHPDGRVEFPQVTRNTPKVSEKMVAIVEAGPWPISETFTIQLAHWTGDGFQVHHLEYPDGPEWKDMGFKHVPKPKKLLNRYDTSLGQAHQ